MHRHDGVSEVLTQAIVRYSVDRVRMKPPPLDHPRTPDELRAMVGRTVTPTGVGGLEALRIFSDVLAPACISTDHPRHLSFVPAAPTEASILFDLVVGASSIYAGSWVEGAGAVFAENEALRWIADLAGLPAEAGGVFVSGGTAGNLSALLAARWKWRVDAGGKYERTRGLIIGCTGAHSSVAQAARAMDADIELAAADARGRLTAEALDATISGLADEDRARVFAVVATSGTTNAGVVDDLVAAAAAADRLGTWFHVDGAYGGAGLAAPSVRHLFAGVERADSFIVDPHKWLFAPFDSCALVYRDPEIARHAHTQHAEYLDVLHDDHDHASAAAGLEHLGLRPPPHAAGPRTAVLVQPGDVRHRRLHGGRGDDPADRPGWRSPRRRRRAPRADPRAGAVDRPVPPAGLDGRRLPGVERRATAPWRVVRHPDDVAGRDGVALVHRQPRDDARRPRRDHRHPGLTNSRRNDLTTCG